MGTVLTVEEALERITEGISRFAPAPQDQKDATLYAVIVALIRQQLRLEERWDLTRPCSQKDLGGIRQAAQDLFFDLAPRFQKGRVVQYAILRDAFSLFAHALSAFERETVSAFLS